MIIKLKHFLLSIPDQDFDIYLWEKVILAFLTLFDMNHQSGGGHFVVIALMIMRFGTSIKLDVFYTALTKSLWRHYYYVIMMS